MSITTIVSHFPKLAQSLATIDSIRKRAGKGAVPTEVLHLRRRPVKPFEASMQISPKSRDGSEKPLYCGGVNDVVTFAAVLREIGRGEVITMLQNKGFVGVKRAAEILDVAPNTVRAWGASGKITEYRHPANNYRLYKRAELEKLLAKLSKSVKSPAKKK